MNANRFVPVVAWVVAAVGLALTWRTWLGDLTYPGMPWQDPHQMADFRDTLWVPGRWLLMGHNPYDPLPYLAANPGSQEFDPYAPAWLIQAVLLALLPFPVAAAFYLVVGAVLAVVLLRLLLGWADPRLLRIGTPVGLVWLELWSPGRYSLQNGSTFLIYIGWALVMRELVRRDAPLSALGLALVLVKPQFGLPLVPVLLAAGRIRTTVRGLVILAVASIPALIVCVIASGGLGGFVEAILRLLSYAGSPDAATGLLSPFNGRTDVLGLLGRFGVATPGWVQLLVAVVATAVACVLARLATPVVMTAGIAAVVLLGLVHQPYDAVILLVPFILGLPHLGWRRGGGERQREVIMPVWALGAVPVVHLHRISMLAIPMIAADVVDATALALCAIAALVRVTLTARVTNHPVSLPSSPPPRLDDADNAPRGPET